MTADVMDFTDLLHGVPAGAWVAISEKQHKVLSFGPDPQEVFREAQREGETVPLILRVPEQSASLFL